METGLHLEVEGGFVPVDALAVSGGRRELFGIRDVGDLLARGPHVKDAIRAVSEGAGATIKWEEARFAPPVLRPGKIVCVGLNYPAHIEESRITKPDKIELFSKCASCLVPHGGNVVRHKITSQLDYEGELAVVIGRRARNVVTADALRAVAGFTIVNDVSARDLQAAEPQWIRGKALDTFAPMGPVVLDVESAPPIATMRILTKVNGEVRQDAFCSLMITSVPELIAYISGAITLEPGDIVATGTPAGVGSGMRVPKYLQDGDVVSVAIGCIGELTNRIVGEDAEPRGALETGLEEVGGHL